MNQIILRTLLVCNDLVNSQSRLDHTLAVSTFHLSGGLYSQYHLIRAFQVYETISVLVGPVRRPCQKWKKVVVVVETLSVEVGKVYRPCQQWSVS